MQQQAWLNAAPGKSKSSRYAGLVAKAKKDGAEPSPYLTLPEIPAAVAHVADYLFEVGPTSGEHPVSFGELESWCSVTGTQLTEFEASSLRSLSKSYLGMMHAACAVDCPPPVTMQDETVESEAERRTRVEGTLRSVLKGLNSPKAKEARNKKRRETRE